MENIVPRNLTKILFTYEDQKYVILVLYCPWKDDINFFEKVFDDNLTDDTDLVSYVVDWNISLYQLTDTYGYLHENNVNNREYIKEQMTTKELTDIWHIHNYSKLDYTSAKNQQKNGTPACLDFLLASLNIIPRVKDIKISLSDHRPLTFTIASNSMANGPRFWRLDNNLLKDPLYVNECNHVIRSTVIEYTDLDIDLF